MAKYDQLPGRLDIRVKNNNDLDIAINVTADLSSYTLSSSINGSTGSTFALTVSDTTGGDFVMSLTDSQITSFGTGTHNYRVDWTIGSYTRTIIEGDLIIL